MTARPHRSCSSTIDPTKRATNYAILLPGAYDENWRSYCALTNRIHTIKSQIRASQRLFSTFGLFARISEFFMPWSYVSCTSYCVSLNATPTRERTNLLQHQYTDSQMLSFIHKHNREGFFISKTCKQKDASQAIPVFRAKINLSSCWQVPDRFVAGYPTSANTSASAINVTRQPTSTSHPGILGDWAS